MRLAARSKPSITSWRAVNASYTCNCIPIGRLGLIRKGARRGNENRRQPMEVLPFTPSTSSLPRPILITPFPRTRPPVATDLTFNINSINRSRATHMSRSDRCGVVSMQYALRLIKKMRSINEGLSWRRWLLRSSSHLAPLPAPLPVPAIISLESSIALNSAPSESTDIVYCLG